jgi:glutamyl-tRNA reductase
MTQNEREEFIFDLAVHRVKKLSQAGIFAMAVDQMCALLANESEERLLEIAPANLYIQDKKKHNTPTGF